jgi:hypothetical protein
MGDALPRRGFFAMTDRSGAVELCHLAAKRSRESLRAQSSSLSRSEQNWQANPRPPRTPMVQTKL